MNQHIIKLVRQALNECVSTPVESVIASRIDNHGIVEIPNTFAEKFAELIVRECIGVVEGGSFLHDQAPTAIFARECSGAIKRHFGVE